MGANVTRTDPKTGNDRVYYKADNGKLYNDYDSAVTARESQIKNVMGVNANIIDPTKQSTAVRAIAPAISKNWGGANYANPVNNTIGIDNYSPGSRPYLEAHEAGHLSYEGAGPAKLLGVSGRTVTGISDRLGNPAPLDAIGGLLTRTFDASEEDRAERLSAKYGPALGGNPEDAPTIDSQGRSSYGNSLRKAGDARFTKAISPIVDPIKQALGWAQDQVQGPQRSRTEGAIREELTRFRELNSGDTVTPELTNSSNRLSELQKTYTNAGGDFDKFVGSF